MLIREQPCNGGTQKLYRFENGYGASVIKHPFSYGSGQGLWELACIKWTGEGTSNDDWDLCYEAEGYGDVIGYLSDLDVADHLNIIKSLTVD